MTDYLPAELPYKVPPTALPLDVERFIQEYVICGNPARAYRSAFGESRSKHPARSGRDLLTRPEIRARLRVHQDAIATMSVKSTEVLIRELEEMVEADVGELVRIRTGACRYCHGVGGFYQWRDMAEYEKAVNQAIEMRKPSPECTGGFGYRFDAGPVEGCVHCEGEGVQRVHLADTDTVSPGARRLYKGLECNPDGSVKKVILHDQLAARVELHRVRGMHIDRSMSINVNANLPDAKEIASSPEKVNDFLESLKT
jgi:phage terminase small subunit